MNEHDCLLGVVGDGPSPSDVLGIGIAPGRNEWLKSKKPFTGPAGKLLDGTLPAVGWSRDKMFLTNLICWWEDSPTPEEIAICRPRLEQEIEAVNPALVVLFGGIVSDEILGNKKYKRGHLYWRDNRWWLPTIHPAAFLHRDSAFSVDIADFARDLGKIKEASTWRNRPPPKPNVIVAESAEEAEAILWSLHGLTSIDIESSYDSLPFVYPPEGLVGTDDAKVLCFGVSNDRGTWVIPGKFISQVRPGWGSRDAVEWIMHLGLFDKERFKRLTGEDLGSRWTEDTLYQSYSLDERGGSDQENDRAVGVHGLKLISNEFLGAEEYNINVLKAGYDDLHYYNGCDVFFTRQLQPIFKQRQIDDNVRDMYEKILMPSAKVLSEIQEHGAHIDLDMLFHLGARWSAKWLETYQVLMDEAVELGWKGPELNLNSHPQMTKFIFDILGCKPHPIHGRSTRKEVMEDLADDIPWCRRLIEWRQNDHMLNTYIVGIEDDIKYDGRIHPQPVLHGTRSGRLAYHKPPIATTPKHGVDPEYAQIRALIDATDDEYVIVEADLRQAELWGTAYLSGDKVMLAALHSGDAHAETAKVAFNVDESHPMWKAYRELGKLFNFGTLYNRTAKGYAKNPFQGRKPPTGLENYKLTAKEAQTIINRQFANWPMVKEWQKTEIRQAFRTGEQVTVVGRKRRYWLPNFKTVNQSVNFNPQSLAHEYLLDSLRKLHFALREYDAHILFEVHDSLVIEARKSWLDETLHLVKSIMTEPKFGFGGIPCDISVGSNWYNVEKVEV